MTSGKAIVMSLILLLAFDISYAEWYAGYSSTPVEYRRGDDLTVKMIGDADCEISLNFPGIEDGESAILSGFLIGPAGAQLKIDIIKEEFSQYDGAGFNSEYHDEDLIAAASKEYKSGIVLTGKPGIMRGKALYPITIYPFKKSNDYLRVTKELDFRVTFLGGKNGQKIVTSDDFEAIFKNNCWNFSDETDEFVPSSYLIICPDEYADIMQEFVLWKNQKGVKTDLVKFSQIGANSTDESIIYDYVLSQYESEDPPEYLLLVGDETKLPVHYVFTPDPVTMFSTESFPGYYINDNYYACLEGNDYFPDLCAGRFVVNNTTNLLKIVRKIVGYEKTPNMLNTDWYRQGLACADDSEPTMRTTKLLVRDIMLNGGGEFTSVDTVFGSNSVNFFINQANSGKSIINYRGTGWSQGWYGIGIFSQNINNLTNAYKLSVVTGIGCGVAKFDDGAACFGEAWMNAGTVNNQTGAVAFIGPTWNTHTFYNNDLDLGIHLALWQDSVRTLGPALIQGKMEVQQSFAPYIAVYDEVEEIVRTLFGQYTLLSDPELTVRAAPPRAMECEFTETIELGISNINATVTDAGNIPLAGMQVSVYSLSEGEISVGSTNGNGQISLPVDLEILPNKVYFTVTGLDYKPFTDSIDVYCNDAYVAHYEYNLFEDPPGDGLLAPGETILLSEVLMNYGGASANNVIGILSSITTGIYFTVDSAVFGNISAGMSAQGSRNFVFMVPAGINENIVNLNIAASSGTQTWDSPINIEVHRPEITLEEYFFNPGVDNMYERGGEVEVTITIKNTGNLGAANLTGTLTSLNPEEAIVTTGEVNFDSLNTNMSEDNEDTPFKFVVAGTCPYDFTAHFDICIAGNQGTFEYEQHFLLEVEIGDPYRSDPSTDVQGLYYAYEARDSYLQAPEYEWREISPAAGGEGTLIDMDVETQIHILNLPFNFQYYGEDFYRITVSADGYLVPDSLGENSTPVWSFIHQSDCAGTIAAMWHDFGVDESGEGDISYLYDSEDGSFRIEYRNWPHSDNFDQRETFQIVIYDANTHPTPTGDNEIEFIFAQALPYTQFTSHCGIEDPEENDGIAIYQMYALFPATSWPPVPNTCIRFTTIEPEWLGVEGYPEISINIPKAIFLDQNYPNPFNPQTNIRFSIPSDGMVALSIYNILGKKTGELVKAYKKAGSYDIIWNAGDIPSGIYFIRLEHEGKFETVKCMLLK